MSARRGRRWPQRPSREFARREVKDREIVASTAAGPVTIGAATPPPGSELLKWPETFVWVRHSLLRC
jgi:hypothetical protein